MFKNSSLLSVVTLGVIMSLASCGGDDNGPVVPPPSQGKEVGKALVWLTTGDQSRLLSRENDVSIVEEIPTTLPVITVNASNQLQEIEGFGAALTGSSAYLINKMNAGQRTTLLNELFDAESGIGINYLRMTIGASDFSLSDYTYNDMPAGQEDFDLDNFSIDADRADVVPVLKQIIGIAPDIKIMGTPWSPPAWMKTNENLKGGKLRTDCYDVYANYFTKYIQAFEDEGITIDAITPQNEPLHFTAGYPCMEMTPTEQRDFIKNSLGPAFEDNNIETKIIIYDHNWDQPNYAISILNDATAKQYVAGSAFHAYGGDVSAMSTVRNAHPDRGLYFTEISGGEWAKDFSENLQWNMSNIFIGTTNNWSKNVLLWNLALDQNFGPKNGGCADCRGVVTIASTGAVTRNVEYYSIGHFSKFIRAGAHRVSSSVSVAIPNISHVAFVNTDGTNVMVVSNSDTNSRAFTVKAGTAQFNYTVPGKSVVTIRWKL